MKVVYALTSSDKDNYLEECFISISSLLYRNSSIKVIILTDAITYERIEKHCTYDFSSKCQIIQVHFDEKINQRIRSRILKISTRQYIEGKFLFIDTDTIITERIDKLDDIECKIGMVLDHHQPISKNISREFYSSNAQKAGFSIGYNDNHFNSGVMLVNDSAEVFEFFDLWLEAYLSGVKKGVYNDQASLNDLNNRLGGFISELDGEWNVQLDAGLKYIGGAKIIHYFNFAANKGWEVYKDTIPYILYKTNLFEAMKKAGGITPEIQEIIESPKRAFKNTYLIPDDCISFEIVQSYLFKVLKYLYVNHRGLFSFLNQECMKLYNLRKKEQKNIK